MMPGAAPKAIVPEPPATTLTYDQSAQLMNDFTFRGRVKVAALKFATAIEAEDSTVTAHTTRLKWAANALNNPDIVAQQLTPGVVMDPSVQQGGSEISDDGLQEAVETLINKIM